MHDWSETLAKFPEGYTQEGASVRRVFRHQGREVIVSFNAEECARPRRFVLAMVEKRERSARLAVGLPDGA